MSVDFISQQINSELGKDNPDFEYIHHLRKQVLGYWPSEKSTRQMINDVKKLRGINS